MSITFVVVLLIAAVLIGRYWGDVKVLYAKYPVLIRLAILIVVVLGLLNSNVREMIWSKGKPAVQGWTTGAKTFDVTITSSDEFVIGKIGRGQWSYSVSRVTYWCKTPGVSGFFSGVTSGEGVGPNVPNGAPAPRLTPSALVITTKDLGGYIAPKQLLVTNDGDEITGVLNTFRNCKMHSPITAQITLSPL